MNIGIDVIINDYACIQRELVQFRFPSSKKKRIRKKWKKRRENYRMTDVHKCLFIKATNTMMVSTEIYNKIEKHFNPQKSDIKDFMSIIKTLNPIT